MFMMNQDFDDSNMRSVVRKSYALNRTIEALKYISCMYMICNHCSRNWPSKPKRVHDVEENPERNFQTKWTYELN